MDTPHDERCEIYGERLIECPFCDQWWCVICEVCDCDEDEQ